MLFCDNSSLKQCIYSDTAFILIVRCADSNMRETLPFGDVFLLEGDGVLHFRQLKLMLRGQRGQSLLRSSKFKFEKMLLQFAHCIYKLKNLNMHLPSFDIQWFPFLAPMKSTIISKVPQPLPRLISFSQTDLLAIHILKPCGAVP